MDEGIKRKLVGAGVLMTVALILLPQITPKSQNAEYLAKSVPLEKDIPNMDMPLPKSIAVTSIAPVNAQGDQEVRLKAIQVDGESSAAHSFKKPEQDSTGQSKVWHIQVASFEKAENAHKLKSKLRKAGYKAFEQLSEDGKYVRVFVGPNSQKEQLQEQLNAIKQSFKLDGQIPIDNDKISRTLTS